ncbi:hypothetical protein BGZ63DRAFT_241575 [Mariannaea sp. PMI_226]|nr:hypothetical protein BGZ63DRAFT_241575 [Mariannaea sp. PMI_226]
MLMVHTISSIDNRFRCFSLPIIGTKCYLRLSGSCNAHTMVHMSSTLHLLHCASRPTGSHTVDWSVVITGASCWCWCWCCRCCFEPLGSWLADRIVTTAAGCLLLLLRPPATFPPLASQSSSVSTSTLPCFTLLCIVLLYSALLCFIWHSIFFFIDDSDSGRQTTALLFRPLRLLPGNTSVCVALAVVSVIQY